MIYDEIKDKSMRTCFACQLGRMHAFPSLVMTGKDYAPLECIAVDYKGKTSTPTSCTGFYLISDHKTSAVGSYPCTNKGARHSTAVLRPRGAVSDYIFNHHQNDQIERNADHVGQDALC